MRSTDDRGRDNARARLARWCRAILVAAVPAACLAGCGASGPTTFRYDANRYDETFRAARETLLEFDFPLVRVDGRRGVLATGPKPTAGLATPWDRGQSGLADEWEDFTNRQMRSAEIIFDTSQDEDNVERVGEVRVTLFRVNRPGQRIETESIGTVSRWFDPNDDPGAPNPALFLVPLREDRELAARLAAAVSEAITQDDSGDSAVRQSSNGS
ncbi:MAG: hypothetical protein AAF235_07810 [Planctomycetota bacterium]